MTQRITQSMMTNTLLSDLQGITDRLALSQSRLSSGKQIQKPSDDPYGTSKALSLRADLASNKQYQVNVQDASSWQDVTDGALSDITSLLQRARDLTVQGATDTTGTQGRQAIVQEINQIIDAIKTTGNTEYAGRYIFAGTKTDTPPYTPGGADAYSGDAGTIFTEIGQGVQVPTNIVGSSVIGDGATPGSLIATLRTIASDLTAGNGNALQTTDLSALDAVQNVVSSTRATVGAVTNRLQTGLSRLQQFEESTTKLLSNTEDADMTQTIVDYSQQQAVYQAALKAGAQVIQPSLMDFLR